MIGRQFPVLQAVGCHQRLQAVIGGTGDLLQAVLDDNPVLIHQLHHVPHRSESCEGKQFLQQFPGAGQRFGCKQYL